MQPDTPDFASLTRSLDSERVRFVVIGGLATVLHGSDHSTVDCDFAVPNADNRKLEH